MDKLELLKKDFMHYFDIDIKEEPALEILDSLILEAKQEVLSEFKKILDIHRSGHNGTCEEECFCWNLDTTIMQIGMNLSPISDKSSKNQATESSTDKLWEKGYGLRYLKD